MISERYGRLKNDDLVLRRGSKEFREALALVAALVDRVVDGDKVKIDVLLRWVFAECVMRRRTAGMGRFAIAAELGCPESRVRVVFRNVRNADAALAKLVQQREVNDDEVEKMIAYGRACVARARDVMVKP